MQLNVQFITISLKLSEDEDHLLKYVTNLCPVVTHIVSPLKQTALLLCFNFVVDLY
jgi:hypothetical protein